MGELKDAMKMIGGEVEMMVSLLNVMCQVTFFSFFDVGRMEEMLMLM